MLGKKNEENGYTRDIFNQEEVIDLIRAHNENNTKKIGIPLRILRNYEKENGINLIEFIEEKH